MKKVYPSYYKEFQCTASECSDNCCIGWEIDVDKETLKKYRKMQRKAKIPILPHIDRSGDNPHFILTENQRCPFLDEQNLCVLQAEIGEEALCEICRLHPRFINRYGNRWEYGLDMCCEEAAGLILSQQKFPAFIEEEVREKQRNIRKKKEDLAGLDMYLFCRNRILDYVSHCEESISKMAEQILAYCDIIEEQIIQKKADIDLKTLHVENCEVTRTYPIVDPTKDYYKTCIQFLRKQIPLSVSWHNFLADVEYDLDEIYKDKTAFTKQYPYYKEHGKQLLYHYIYRYGIEGIWMERIYAEYFVAVFFVQIIELLDVAWYHYHGTFSFADQIYLCTRMAKEIEYSEENLEALLCFGDLGGEVV